jgi:hypothetical protein
VFQPGAAWAAGAAVSAGAFDVYARSRRRDWTGHGDAQGGRRCWTIVASDDEMNAGSCVPVVVCGAARWGGNDRARMIQMTTETNRSAKEADFASKCRTAARPCSHSQFACNMLLLRGNVKTLCVGLCCTFLMNSTVSVAA